jgi:SPP1 gp7 family putative phage head morphogenesis protein
MAETTKPSDELVEQAYLLLSEAGAVPESPRMMAVLESQLSVAAAATRKQTFSRFAKSVGVKLSPSYNPVSPAVVAFAREQSSLLVKQVTDATRRGIAEVIATELQSMTGVQGAQRKVRARLLADKLSRNMDMMAGLDAARISRVLTYEETLLENGYSAADAERMTRTFARRELNARSQVIARTEMRRSVESAQRETEKDLGAREKEWVTSRDDKVSEQCDADHQAGWLPVDEAFPSGNQEPPGHPNCRCTLNYRHQAWEKTLDDLRRQGVIE